MNIVELFNRFRYWESYWEGAACCIGVVILAWWALGLPIKDPDFGDKR
jgi:hypothetical protein